MLHTSKDWKTVQRMSLTWGMNLNSRRTRNVLAIIVILSYERTALDDTTESSNSACIPYSRKIWRGIKFGVLAIYSSNCQIKICQNFLFAYIHMVIPYRTTKFKSANMFAMAIWDPTTKFNSRQYFRLYGIQCKRWQNLLIVCLCWICD